MYQIQPDAPLLYLDQNHIVIKKLLVLETGLDNLESQRKYYSEEAKVTSQATTIKLGSTGFSLSHAHFIELLTDMIKKPLQRHYDEL
jgi:hypothetical protein